MLFSLAWQRYAPSTESILVSMSGHRLHFHTLVGINKLCDFWHHDQAAAAAPKVAWYNAIGSLQGLRSCVGGSAHLKKEFQGDVVSQTCEHVAALIDGLLCD